MNCFTDERYDNFLNEQAEGIQFFERRLDETRINEAIERSRCDRVYSFHQLLLDNFYSCNFLFRLDQIHREEVVENEQCHVIPEGSL